MFILIITFTILSFLGMPIGFVLLGSSLTYILISGNIPVASFIQRVIIGTQSFPLIAVLMFIFMGNILNVSGISKKMMDFAYSLTGHVTGGLAQVNVLLSTLLSGMSGSANGDAAMQAKMLVPEMIKKGYSPSFSAVVTAASSLIAPMIPPGIGLIVFGFVANVSIGKLFMGGILPGLLMAAGLMMVVFIISKKRGYGKDMERKKLKQVVLSFFGAFPALLLILIIIGGVRLGIFTPSEVGGIACIYALFLGVIYKQITLKTLFESLKSTASQSAAIMLILAASSAFSYILTFEQIPQQFAALLVGVTQNQQIMLILIFLFLLIAGMFIEGTSGIIILAPMFMPIIKNLGIDPVHFGIIMVYAMHMGGITPPVGLIMYTVCSIIKEVSIADFVKESLPFIIILIIIGLLIIFNPKIVTFLAYI